MSAAARTGPIDFERVAQAALRNSETVVRSLLPNGRRDGVEWIALNPRRDDRRPGSFRCNLSTGAWADFATATVRGRDLVSLAAFVCGLTQREAALKLADSLGVSPFVQ